MKQLVVSCLHIWLFHQWPQSVSSENSPALNTSTKSVESVYCNNNAVAIELKMWAGRAQSV